MIRILIMHEQGLFSAGLRSLIENESELTVIGVAGAWNEGIELARQGRPDVILLNLDLCEDCRLDSLSALVEAAAGARLVVLMDALNPAEYSRAIAGGAMGVVLKGALPQVLFKAIHKIHAGEAWLNRKVMATTIIEMHERHSERAGPATAAIASLTPREREVIALVGEGLRNKMIGEKLFISEKTVCHYMTSIFAKTGVTDRLELMIYAFQHGLAKIPSLQIAR